MASMCCKTEDKEHNFSWSLLLRFSKCGVHVQHLKGILYQTRSDNTQLQGRQRQEDLKCSFEAKQLELYDSV